MLENKMNQLEARYDMGFSYILRFFLSSTQKNSFPFRVETLGTLHMYNIICWQEKIYRDVMCF